MGREVNEQLEIFGGYVVFVSVPSEGDFDGRVQLIRDAAAAVGRLTGEVIEVVVGSDAPLPPGPDRRAWIRALFATDVDALIEFHAPSFGGGHEDGIAAALRLPRLLLFHEGDSRSAAAGGDGAGRLDEGTYKFYAEIRELVTQWLLEAIGRLRNQQLRRERGADLVSPARRQALQALENRDDDFQRGLAEELELTRSQLLDIACDDGRYAALSAGDRAYLEWSLNPSTAEEPERTDSETTLPLTPRQRRAFEQAKRTWNWSEETANAVMRRGVQILAETRDHDLAGQPSRYSLESRLGWHTVYQDLCDGPA